MKLRRMGIEYVRFFLESIPVWASWVGEEEGEENIFDKGYRMLKQGGLEFPEEKEYVIYTEQNVEKKYGL